MTEESPKCIMCGSPLSARAVENGYKYCWQCWTKSREANGSGKPGPASSRHDQQGTGDNLKIEAGEDSSVISMKEPKEGDETDGVPVIFSYTTEQAVEDGVLVYVGDVGRNKVYFTGNLMAEGYKDFDKRRDLVNRGIELLKKPDPEDTPYMWLRVIEKDRWVIAEPVKLTYMLPDDY